MSDATLEPDYFEDSCCIDPHSKEITSYQEFLHTKNSNLKYLIREKYHHLPHFILR